MQHESPLAHTAALSIITEHLMVMIHCLIWIYPVLNIGWYFEYARFQNEVSDSKMWRHRQMDQTVMVNELIRAESQYWMDPNPEGKNFIWTLAQVYDGYTSRNFAERRWQSQPLLSI